MQAAQALAVAWKESKWDPTIRNSICCAAGLFQITKGAWNRTSDVKRQSRSDIELDPYANARVAYAIWEGDPGYYRGWGQWSVVNGQVEPELRFRRINLDNPLAYIRNEGDRERAERALDYFYQGYEKGAYARFP